MVAAILRPGGSRLCQLRIRLSSEDCTREGSLFVSLPRTRHRRLRVHQHSSHLSGADGSYGPFREIPSVCLGAPHHFWMAYVCAIPGASAER
jgi:hypothetical protein